MLKLFTSVYNKINKASHGDLSPEELKERQVCTLALIFVCVLHVTFIYSSKSELSLQAKAMQDSEILNNFTDPVMRQFVYFLGCGSEL